MKKAALFFSILTSFTLSYEAHCSNLCYPDSFHSGIKTSPISSAQFSLNSHYYFTTTEDGWLNKYHTDSRKIVLEKFIGNELSNVATSSDGRVIILGNNTQHSITILSAVDLSIIKTIPTTDKNGYMHTVRAIYNLSKRNTFAISFESLKELWEISYETPPPMGFGKWMHDYRENAGENTGLDRSKDLFPVRQIHIQEALKNYIFSPQQELIFGFNSSDKAQIIDLDLGRTTKELTLSTATGISLVHEGQSVLALPAPNNKSIALISIKSWKAIHTIDHPSLAVYSHPSSEYLWSISDHKKIHIFDKAQLKLVKSLDVAQAIHIDFSPDNSRVLIHSCTEEKKHIMYDGLSLEKVKT